MASCGADKVVRIWEPVTSQQVGELRGSMDTVFESSFTASGAQLLAGGADRALRLWDLTTGRVLQTLTGHAQKVCIWEHKELGSAGSFKPLSRAPPHQLSDRRLQGSECLFW